MSDDMRFERRMSDSDALMWGIEKDPLLRSTITAVSLFDRPPDRERLRDRVERGTCLIPRLRQRVVSAPLVASPPRWVFDPNFDLDYHLRRVRAPAPGDRRALLDLAEPIGMQSFDRARPLWEFTVVEGLADGKAAVIQKLHHSITDGVGAIKLAMVLFDLEREPDDPGHTPAAAEAEHPSPWGLTLEALRHERRRQLGIARRAVGSATRAVRRPAANLRSIVELVAFQRNEPALTFTDAIAGILNRLPTAIVTQLFGSMLKGVDFVTSNVPGVPVPVFFAGAALESQVAFGPLTGAAANVTLVSY